MKGNALYFIAGACFALGFTYVSQSPLAPEDLPEIGGFRSADAQISPMDIDLGDWQGWFIHSPTGYRQVAFTMPGQPGVMVGDLFDEEGVPVGQIAARQHERSVIAISDIEGMAAWLSRDFPYAPSVPEAQAARLDAKRETAPLYLVVDPFAPEARQQASTIRALLHEGHVRVIPVASAGGDSYDGLHAIMGPGHIDQGGATSLDLFQEALSGNRVEPVATQGSQADRLAFQDFSKNISLLSRLGIERVPAVIHASAGSPQGIEVTPLREWVER